MRGSKLGRSLEHGLYSAEALAEQKRVRELPTQSRELGTVLSDLPTPLSERGEIESHTRPLANGHQR